MFKLKYLREAYSYRIRYRVIAGIDNINKHSFDTRMDNYLGHISRKALAGTYRFTPYKERLISKGRGKNPRVISIPTIRDRVTLGVLHEILLKSFSSELDQKIVQITINKLKRVVNMGIYNYFYKIDISGFYDNLDHDILMRKMRRKIRNIPLLHLIEGAIQTPTIARTSDSRYVNRRGVPQGLPIANDLANIYISSLDNICKSDPDIFYVRYVDDILVLCDKNHFAKKQSQIDTFIVEKLKLDINKEKSHWGYLHEGFDFLGYSYYTSASSRGFTVRLQSVRKLENSIIKIFTRYKYTKNSRVFLWDLNLRITGIIVDKSKYGWIFFFSQIDSISILFHLDKFVDKMCGQVNVDPNIRTRIKKFVKTYHEIINNLRNTQYIPRVQNFTITQQEEILNEVFKYTPSELKGMTNEQIQREFRWRVRSSIKDLERDFQPVSS